MEQDKFNNIIRNVLKEQLMNRLDEGLKKGDTFKLNGMNPQTMAKMIAAKYGANPADFVPGKNGTIVYQPKRIAKPKTEIVSKPEDMSVEEYKEKLVIPMKPELKDLEDEEWRPLPNKGRYFGGEADYSDYYEISNFGRLRTINLQNAAKSTIGTGYDAPTRNAMQFTLNKKGIRTTPDIKYMVADAFLGEHDLEDSMVIHIDGDYHNNRADNLKWVPRKKGQRPTQASGDVEQNVDIDNIVNESIKKVLNESFSNRMTSAINTIKYLINIESNQNHLSEEQVEQLYDVVNWLGNHCSINKPHLHQWVDAGRKVLNKYANAYGYEIYEKKESGIHINPENKGKFTATKKRTGKSTAELTHSKNPLTKKRAVFAQNAKRWAKKKTNEDTEPGQRPSWQEILKRINDAGVNQAIPRRSANPQTQTQPQPEEQPNQVVQQPKQDGNGIQIGKYVFNPSQHTLTGPDGVKKLRPQYSNAIEAMCKNLGEDAEISKMFSITDDRSFRVLMSMLRKLFIGDPNVKIIAHGGKANIQVNQDGLNENRINRIVNYR